MTAHTGTVAFLCTDDTHAQEQKAQPQTRRRRHTDTHTHTHTHTQMHTEAGTCMRMNPDLCGCNMCYLMPVQMHTHLYLSDSNCVVTKPVCGESGESRGRQVKSLPGSIGH